MSMDCPWISLCFLNGNRNWLYHCLPNTGNELAVFRNHNVVTLVGAASAGAARRAPRSEANRDST